MRRLRLIGVLVLAGLGLFSGPPLAWAQAGNFLNKPLADWVGNLADKEARVRRDAAFALGKMRIQAAAGVPQLVAGLTRSADPTVQKAAVQVWDRIKGQDPAGLKKALQEFKKGKDAAVAKVAAQALDKADAVATVEDRIAIAAVPKLAELAQQDADADVREAAAFALGEIGPAAVKALPSLPGTLVAILDADTNALVRRSAAVALGSLGLTGKAAAAPVRALEKTLRSVKLGRDADAAVRQNAAWALGRLAPPSALALAGALQDDDALVRRDAAAALDQVKVPDKERPAVKKHLFKCFRADADPIVRKTALITLVKLAGKEDRGEAGALKKALKEDDPEVRHNAALALGKVGDVEALPHLIKTLAEEELVDRQKAALALMNLGSAAVPALPELIKALQDPDGILNVNAAVTLAAIGRKARQSAPTLIKVAADTNKTDDARTYAIEALARIGRCQETAEGIPILLKILGDAHNAVRLRQRCIWALEVHDLVAIGALPTFTRVLAEKELPAKLVRYNAATSLAYRLREKMPNPPLDKALDVLLEFLNDKDVSVYHGTGGKLKGAGEGGKGSSKVAREVHGDGRVLAANALAYIGPGVRRRHRNDVISRLQELSRDASSDKLKEAAQQALRFIKKK